MWAGVGMSGPELAFRATQLRGLTCPTWSRCPGATERFPNATCTGPDAPPHYPSRVITHERVIATRRAEPLSTLPAARLWRVRHDSRETGHSANSDALDVRAPRLVGVDVSPVSSGRLAARVVANERSTALAADHLRHFGMHRQRPDGAGITQQTDHVFGANRLSKWHRDIDAPPPRV